MAKQLSKNLLIHIDVDSPLALFEFYGLDSKSYSDSDLEGFYTKAWDRILAFFDKFNIKGTFFVVGADLEKSELIKDIVRKAHNSGHEIENHTHTHPFGLSKMSVSERNNQINLCSDIIEGVTGDRPVGFRAPGYNIDSDIINYLEESGFEYDSSGFWSIMNPVIKSMNKVLYKKGLNNSDFGGSTRKLKQYVYYPDKDNWLKPSSLRSILEIPLPRTPLFALPFYNNFNLFAPSIFSTVVSRTINKPVLVYLFHIVEFMDLTDLIPAELKVHPNLKIPLSKKLKKSENIITNLLKRYEPTKTRDFVRSFKEENV